MGTGAGATLRFCLSSTYGKPCCAATMPCAGATAPALTNPAPRDPLFATIIKAAVAGRHRPNPNYNGGPPRRHRDDSGDLLPAAAQMSTASCYLDPIPTAGTCRSRRRALTGKGLCSTGSAAPASAILPAGEVLKLGGVRESWSCRAFNSAAITGVSSQSPARTPAQSRHRGAPCAAWASARISRINVPRTRWLVGKKGNTFNDRGAPPPGARGAALRLFRQGMLASLGCPIRASRARARAWRAPT